MKNKKIITILTILTILITMLFLSFFNSNIFLKNNKNNIDKENFVNNKEEYFFDEINISKKLFFRKMDKANGIVINIWVENSEFDIFKEHNIKYLFVDIGDTDVIGKIKTSIKDINHFLEKVNKFEIDNNYNFIILPYSEINTYNFDFQNEEFKKNYINDYLNFIEIGFDGVYVDVEPIRDKNEYLIFLNELKNKLPKESLLGVYSGSVSTSQNNNEWEWELDYYEKVSNIVDLIFVPGYDTNINNDQEYLEYMNFQFTELKKANLKSNLIFGIPTHKNNPETIDKSLEVYISQMNEDAYLNNFIGIAIFASWTIDEEEWIIYENYF